MTTQFLRRSIRILIVNPNSSQEMTQGIDRAIRSMDMPDTLEITTYTAPEPSPASIDNEQDIAASGSVVFTDIGTPGLLMTYHNGREEPNYDGILVACYSRHSLVSSLAARYPQIAVIGIFEASVAATLPLLSPEGSWGIVTTGKFWEDHLGNAVRGFLGQDNGESNFRFTGVFSTGLTAGDFHGGNLTPEVIREKMKEATEELLGADKGVEGVIMGCAGMAGLEEIIRATIDSCYDTKSAQRVHIIDGVKAGVGILEQVVKHKRMFLK